MKFFEPCLNGDVLKDEIDRFVEDWHQGREKLENSAVFHHL